MTTTTIAIFASLSLATLFLAILSFFENASSKAKDAIVSIIVVSSGFCFFAFCSVNDAALIFAIVVSLVWFVSAPGRQVAIRIITSVIRSFQDACEEYERRQTLEAARQQEAWARAEQRRLEELDRIASATQPSKKKWTPTRHIDTTTTVTYGIGEEFVYCYTYPTFITTSADEAPPFRLKVGMASRNPIDRIQQQLTSKTAIPERVRVLLVFQTDNCNRLERWLHRRIEDAPNRVGHEWFMSSPEALVKLFRLFLLENSSTLGGLIEHHSSAFGEESWSSHDSGDPLAPTLVANT